MQHILHKRILWYRSSQEASTALRNLELAFCNLFSSHTIFSYSPCLYFFSSSSSCPSSVLSSKAWISSQSSYWSFLIPVPTCCFQTPTAFSFVFPAVTSHQLCLCFHHHPQPLQHVRDLHCASPCKQQERGAAVRSPSVLAHRAMSTARHKRRAKLCNFINARLSTPSLELPKAFLKLSAVRKLLMLWLHLPRTINTDVFTFRQGKLTSAAWFSSICLPWISSVCCCIFLEFSSFITCNVLLYCIY